MEDVVQRAKNKDGKDSDDGIPTTPPPGHDISQLDYARQRVESCEWQRIESYIAKYVMGLIVLKIAEVAH